MPTWLTGALVSVRIAWSATERPRNSQRSPVRVSSTASSRLIRALPDLGAHGTIIA